MFSFVDISGDLSAKNDDRHVVVAAASIKKQKIMSITKDIHRLKKDCLNNETFEVKSTDFINRNTLEHISLNKFHFIERFVKEILIEFNFSAIVIKNAPIGKFFERDRLAEHYVLLMQRINSFARYKKSHALIIIDNQARNIDKWTAFAFNNFLFRANKGIDLENIVEMPIFADSEMTQGIQVADIAAGIIRHYYDKHIADDNRESGFHRKISEYYQLVEKHAVTHDKRFQPIYRTPDNFVENYFGEKSAAPSQ